MTSWRAHQLDPAAGNFHRAQHGWSSTTFRKWTCRKVKPVRKIRRQTQGQRRRDKEESRSLTWPGSRERMREVCTSCHASGPVDGFYTQIIDNSLIANDKFAEATDVVRRSSRANKLTPGSDG